MKKYCSVRGKRITEEECNYVTDMLTGEQEDTLGITSSGWRHRRNLKKCINCRRDQGGFLEGDELTIDDMVIMDILDDEW